MTSVTTLPPASAASRPRWEENMVLFDLQVDQEWVPCAISRAALELLGPGRCFKKDEALACFAKSRPSIEALAGEKLRARGGSQCGRLTLWADDVDEPPPPEGAVGLRHTA